VKIIADESVDYAIIQALRIKGFEIYSITEQSPGIDDKKVLAIANQYKGLLITEDKDFGELTYRLNKKHHGILLIRLSGLPRNERINLVCELIFDHSEKLSGSFSVLNEQGLRIKAK
jgi:predicted nuclease of predicted toxin-antitoxin system